jgi:hypothetical protein
MKRTAAVALASAAVLAVVVLLARADLPVFKNKKLRPVSIELEKELVLTSLKLSYS